MTPLVQCLLLLLLAASLAHAASPLSLRASVLSPSSALLTWSSPFGPLLLSVLSLLSPLSLPSSAGASAHLLLTDLTLSEPMQLTLSSARVASDAGLGLGSSESVHVSLSPWPRVDPAARDLSGARLRPEVACADASCAARRVSWTAAPVSADPHAPPLLYSVFAEWSALTASAALDATAESVAGSRDTGKPASQPTIRRQAIRMCNTQAKSGQQQQAHTNQRRFRHQTVHADEQDHTVQRMHCDVDADQLPRGVELTLHLITECDYRRIDAEAGATLPHCLTAVSPELRVTLDPLPLEVSLPAAPAPTSFTAAPGVAQVANDTAVRQALCVFFNQTSGSEWNTNSGWCDPTMPICGAGTQEPWFGVGCAPSGTFVTSVVLSNNGLVSALSGGVDISPLFTVLVQLQQLELSSNLGLLLSRLDLTPLANLTSLTLNFLPPIPSINQALLLPGSTCRLRVFDLGYTSFAVSGWAACTQLTQISLANVDSPIPLATITLLPLLQQLSASNSALTGDAVGSYGGGLSGGELTLYILAHLNESNPLIQALHLSGCASLPFGLFHSTDNFPRIAAPLLTSLILNDLPLRTGPRGPADVRWLEGMPSLTQLKLIDLQGVVVHTSAFQYASRSLQSLICHCVVGDLLPLFSLPLLVQLTLSGSDLNLQLPSNLSAIWPALSILACSACGMHGALPSFSNLPALTEVYLDRNALVGPIGVDFAAQSSLLSTVVLSSNLLQGPLPSFCGSPSIAQASFDNNLIESFPDLRCYGTVDTLGLQSNPQMRGQLPRDLWQRLPRIHDLTMSNTMLNGSIPDRDPTFPSMDWFLASHCQFSGPLPRNIDAATMDLSQNGFSGPLILFDERFGGAVPVTISLRLASAGNLTCPIQLSALTQLTTLVISGNGFAQCDFTNLMLSATVSELDISDNQWSPFDLLISQSLVSLHVSRANCRGLVVGALPDWSSLALTEITLDGSSFAPHSSQGVAVLDQFQDLLGTNSAPRLRLFSCVGCVGLPQEIANLLQMVGLSMQVIRLDSTELQSRSFALLALPPNLVQFSIAGNIGIQGPLSVMDTALPALESFDASCTSLSGPIPPSWSNLHSLSQLNITNTSIQCDLVVTAESRLQCAAQFVLAVSPTITIEAASLADSTAGVHCSALTIVATGSRSRVIADSTYHSYTQCTCDANSFGLNALCSRCPEGCTCNQDRIQNCFPVVHRGSISVSPASDPAGSRSVIAGSIVAFSVSALLPCPRTVTGDSLCNPDGIAWPRFYRIIETAVPGSVSASLAHSGSSSSSDSELDLSAWCYPGHTGRLCAACSSGYFSSGRWCLRCLSSGVHALILIANLLLIVALIAYLYVKSPGALSSAKGLQLYLRRLSSSSLRGSVSHPMRVIQSDDVDLKDALPSTFAAADAADATAAEAANPLKLLIFHSQQLSLLLHTSTSLPPVIAGLLSVLNSGGTGFSLSSLVALECLSSGWNLSTRCWMAVVAPALIGLVSLTTALFSRKSGFGPRASHGMQLQGGRDEPLLSADPAADGPAPSSSVPRVYSVCVSLLYFIFFPCAQTVLSAVACTDTRESAQSYLNLHPTVACDAEWRRSVLPPAVMGVLFWAVAFPLGSTLVLLRLRARIAAADASESSASASASTLTVWPICSDLLSPYSPRFWHWEQLLLLRRLMLVAAVTIIPSSSLYLPLCLFAIIQLSALQQHWAQPYAHSLLNAGELASLYLLLINYISAIILQTGLTEGGFQQTANGWAAALFAVNAAFLLILVAGLFGWARQRIEGRLRSWKHQRL